MGKLGDGIRLLKEFTGFAKERNQPWIVPLVIFLAFVAVLVVAGQVTAPLLYTLF